MSHVTCTATLVRCLDPRFVTQIETYMREKYGEGKYESMGIAGPSKEIAGKTLDGECLLNTIGRCIKLHNTPKVVLMLHNDCGNYAIKDPIEEKRIQFEDAKKCQEIIIERFPELSVETIWVEKNFETGQISFSPIE